MVQWRSGVGQRRDGRGAQGTVRTPRLASFTVAATIASAACTAAHVAPAPAPVLPLTTLRLYETGIGYFERSGRLRPGEHASLPVPAAHLDDALLSLVVLTPDGGGKLRGVQFGGSASRGMARALAGLSTPAESPLAYRDLLASLKGARVDVTTHAKSFTGRLVDLDGEGAAYRLLVATDAGDLVRIAESDVQAVRPLDGDVAARLDTAVEAQSTRAARTRTILDVLATSRAPITLRYVAEAPVWRTTYRLLLGDGKAPSTLQAWALVHNDTDEDWQGVRLELANGRPDSFLFPMAAPRYARRPLVHPEDTLSTVPQLLDRTADALWGDFADESYGSGGLGAEGTGEGGGGQGEGFGNGSFGGIGHGKLSGSSTVLAVGDLAKVAQAPGTEAGALFVYTMPDPLALRAHSSALVPFLEQPIDAEPIAWVAEAGAPARSAVRFVNSTTQTLPAGTIAFFSGGGFAGESGLDRLKPGERRFVQFGADLDLTAEAAAEGAPADADERLTWEPRVLLEHYTRTTRTKYTLTDRSAGGRAVVLPLSITRNARVAGADATDFDVVTATPLAVVHVGPHATVEREIVTVEGLARSHPFDSLTAKELEAMAAASTMAAADRAVATEAAARVGELEATRAARKAQREAIDALDKELERLRDDAKALGGERGTASAGDLARRVLAAEDRYTAAKKGVDALDAEEKTRADRAVAVLARLGR